MSYHTCGVIGVLGKQPKSRALGVKLWSQHAHFHLGRLIWKTHSRLKQTTSPSASLLNCSLLRGLLLH